ncbi:MAG: hypothetical protein ACRDDD_12015 [Plesiomonas sp.]|uniref:hypothetical protein n=1 Tax=Plesiomonas sp. TaxID=2486279 RepID=UPI003EE72391
MEIRSTPRVSSKQLNQLVKSTEKLSSNLKKKLKRLDNTTDDKLNIHSFSRKKLLLTPASTRKKLQLVMNGKTVDELRQVLDDQKSKIHDKKSRKIDKIKENIDKMSTISTQEQSKLIATELVYRTDNRTGKINTNKNLMTIHKPNRFSFTKMISSMR